MTLGDTFQNLQDDVLDYGYGEADRNRIKAFINDEYIGLFAKKKWPWSEGTATISQSAAASTATAPSMSTTAHHYGKIQRILTPTSYQDIQPPEWVDYDTDDPLSWVNNNVTITGVPTEYSFWGGTVYFDRLAPVAMTYNYIYWTIPTRLSANGDEPSIPDQHREILRWGALKRLAIRERDNGLLALASAMYDPALAAMIKDAQKDINNDYADMPQDYRGGYDQGRR